MRAPGLTPRQILPSGPDIEARAFRGALSRSEWTLRGGRNHVFLLLAGGGEATIDGARSPLTRPCLVWVPAGARGTIGLEAGADGAWLGVSDTALGPAMPAGPVFGQVREAVSLPIAGVRLEQDRARRLATTLEAIRQELDDDRPGAREAVRHHLALLLIAIWRISNPTDAPPRPSPRTIVHGFLHLVDLHARDHWPVERYARFLGVSADRLNSAVRRGTGRSPLAIVHARLVAEAETLLDGSTLQIAEIADALGFRDAAYFSRFFKRMTGKPPRGRRDEAMRRAARAEASFAAWP